MQRIRGAVAIHILFSATGAAMDADRVDYFDHAPDAEKEFAFLQLTAKLTLRHFGIVSDLS